MNFGVPVAESGDLAAFAFAGDSDLELVRGGRASAFVTSGLSWLVILLFRGGNWEAAAPAGPGAPATCGGGGCVGVLADAGVWICRAGGPLALLFPAACFSRAMRSLGLRLGDEPADPDPGVGGPLLDTARSPAVNLPGL